MAEKLALEQDVREWQLEREVTEERKRMRRRTKRPKVPAAATGAGAEATGADAEAATTGEGGAGRVNRLADEHRDAESTQGDGATTQAPPAGAGGIADEPELPEEALRIFDSMFECTPPHTPGMPPPVLDIS